jgi:hypothetical protein
MNYILKYENFNESKGISDSCEKFLYRIWNSIESDINDLKSNEYYFDIDEFDFKCKKIKIKFKILLQKFSSKKRSLMQKH